MIKIDPNRRDEMILQGDAVELGIMVLERFAFVGAPFTPADALLVAATMRMLADQDPPRTLKMPEVRLLRSMHYGPSPYKRRCQGEADG